MGCKNVIGVRKVTNFLRRVGNALGICEKMEYLTYSKVNQKEKNAYALPRKAV